MRGINNSEYIFAVGTADTDLDLFESQYPVPDGVTYNSYVILDEKAVVMDTVDARKTKEWLKNVETVLNGRQCDYLVVNHMEPDHSASIEALSDRYPEMKIVGNVKTFIQMKQFFSKISEERFVTVTEGETLELGTHTLHFVMAPMVHWPEVMVAYESTEKVLFSADAFGTFGVSEKLMEEWKPEAARYFLNIVGKYGAQVQALLKKAAALDIKMILPLHGPILSDNLSYYISLYDTWSSYRPEESNEILVTCASIHGHTKTACDVLVKKLRDTGAVVREIDLTRTDVSYAVAEAFRCGKIIFACATYDGGLFPPMEAFLAHLKSKNWQNRITATVENGSWAPMAARKMREELEKMKNITICENNVTIKSALSNESLKMMDELVKEITQR